MGRWDQHRVDRRATHAIKLSSADSCPSRHSDIGTIQQNAGYLENDGCHVVACEKVIACEVESIVVPPSDFLFVYQRTALCMWLLRESATFVAGFQRENYFSTENVDF